MFLHGCGLPRAWLGQAQWRIFDTAFGTGLSFLAAWRAWKDDPLRPRMLHYVSVDASPARAEDLLHSAAPHVELVPLAAELAEQWFGLAPGAHRLAFEGGAVLLTLHVRDAREMLRRDTFIADSVFLGAGQSDEPVLKGVARHCRRGTRLAASTALGGRSRVLEACGFTVRHETEAVFDPRWEPKGMPAARKVEPAQAIVVGSGLAGAAAAASLARRGWQVTVVDAAADPAGGASGLPVGMVAPHTSPDDNLLSRLSRAGVRMTLQCAAEVLRADEWAQSGVLEHHIGDGASSYPGDGGYAAWQRAPSEAQARAAGLGESTATVWHEHAGWIKPSALVRALLRQPGIRTRGNARVTRLEPGKPWTVHLADGSRLDAAVVIVAAALDSAALCPGLDVNAVRGQVAWGPQDGALASPPFPVNGHGHFIPGVPTDAGPAWFCGSTYGRGDTDARVREADTAVNLERLSRLLPAVHTQLNTQEVRSWAGVRCTSRDRRPLVGEWAPGLWVCTAMGSRGLTFCVLAAELIAAKLHHEPLPLTDRLAAAIDVRR